MSTLEQVKAAVRTAAGVTDEASWTAGTLRAHPQLVGVQQCSYATVKLANDETIAQLFVRDYGGAQEEAWCAPGVLLSNGERFNRLVLEWCAARIAAGWFVDVSHWGEECALGWGINASGVVQTAMFTWATSEKLALKADLGFPVPGAPTTDIDKLVVLANDTTAIDFANGSLYQVTVTAARTLTATVPPSNRPCMLKVLTTGTTSYTITFGNGFTSTGTLATGTTNNRVFAISFRSDGTKLIESCRSAAMVP